MMTAGGPAINVPAGGSQPAWRVRTGSGNRAYATFASPVSCSTPAPCRRLFEAVGRDGKDEQHDAAQASQPVKSSPTASTRRTEYGKADNSEDGATGHEETGRPIRVKSPAEEFDARLEGVVQKQQAHEKENDGRRGRNEAERQNPRGSSEEATYRGCAAKSRFTREDGRRLSRP